jgi:heme exporter protein C
MNMLKHSWKALAVLLLLYGITAGWLMRFPILPILNETIRNVFFHVTMWYAMIICYLVSGIYAIIYLLTDNWKNDIRCAEFAFVGTFFGCLGMVTGMEWANFTWGEPWSKDPKQLGAAACLAVYFAYILLRSIIKDEDKQGRITAVYNIFALALLFPLVYIIPNHAKSLHPGTDGNNFQAIYSQGPALRKVQLPIMLGWILLSVWIAELRIRISFVKYRLSNPNFLMKKKA